MYGPQGPCWLRTLQGSGGCQVRRGPGVDAEESGTGTLPCRVAISTGSLGVSHCRCSILGCCDVSSSTPGFCGPASLQVPSPLCLPRLCHARPQVHFGSLSGASLQPAAGIPACISAKQQPLVMIIRQQLEQLQLMLTGTGGTLSPQTGEKGSSGHQWLLPTPCSIP